MEKIKFRNSYLLKYRDEILDEVDSRKEADRLLREYNKAFHTKDVKMVIVKVNRGDK